MSDESRPSNRLIDETSPYLHQHAHNPVDWYPWGEAALGLAAEQDRPIFLSIGYSACHWCHVMAHESFEDEATAALMNRWFVNIKVDREERPDLDRIYMNAVLALTGRGGWPMSVFLTPDRRPFYGGTYWPRESRMGMPGFPDILEQVHQAWDQRREDVLDGAKQLTAAVVRMGRPQQEPTGLSEKLLEQAERALLQAADREQGGFGGAPKFPHSMDLRFLLRASRRFDNRESLDIARLALDKMAAGGIYDHLGGGFHRYSTDAQWLVPHFEKMLYDNALLASTYVEAFQVTGEESYARIVREILDYVLREMTQPEGGFYSTQDADSEGEEGRYFVWTKVELEKHLGGDDAAVLGACYGVTSEGNWEGKNILHRVMTDEEATRRFGMDADELRAVLVRCRQTLLAVRGGRIAPGRDEKLLVSWNGLMIAAMSKASQVLGEPRYAVAAEQAADFITKTMRDKSGRLLRCFKDGRSRLIACLEDYACLIDGLVELYQTTFEPRWIETALMLATEMIDRFSDEEQRGFYDTAVDHEPLIARYQDSQDGATPSGNAMAATALLRLGRLCGHREIEARGARTLEMLSGQLEQFPMSGGQALLAVDFLLGPTAEFVLADGENPPESDELLEVIRSRFLPNMVVLRRPRDMTDDGIPQALRPLLSGRRSESGAATVFLCERGTCGLPIVGRSALEESLDG